MAKQTGKIFFNIPGHGRVDSRPGATVDFGGPIRTAQESDVVIGNYTERDQESNAQFTINHDALTDEIEIGRVENVTLNFQTDSGVSWILPECYSVRPGQLTDGGVSYEYSGKPAKKIS